MTIPPEEKSRGSEREQTDESLHVEREKVDDALTDVWAAIDETADAVLTRARARADELLAATRARADRNVATSGLGAQSPGTIVRERAREDRAVKKERADADEVLNAERAAQVGVFSIERAETDKDLSSERARSDHALVMRDTVLGIVSHDLRSMLHSIIGFAGLIARDASEASQADQIRMNAQRIHRGGARMSRLIGDLVDVASIEAGALAVTHEVSDPKLVVTESVDTFQAQALASKVSLITEIVEPLPPTAFDPARILQVLINLLGNALKFTPANGRIVVRVEHVGDELRFSVRDTGAGIPADKLDTVFERFLQVNRNDRRGVGLGLYISRCIVQAHGGRIWAESKPGEGSVFSFALPIQVAP